MDFSSSRCCGHWMANLGELALPTELWTHIFSFTPVVTICQVRLVCRRWRDIVSCCPKLLDRLRVVLEKPEASSDLVMDEGFVVPTLLPVPHVTLTNWTICAVAWWSDFSQKLREISIYRSKVHMTALLNMVKHSPNLKSLRLQDLWIRGSGRIIRPSFQLEGMQKLAMNCVYYDGLVDVDALQVFVFIFPRLRDFQLRNPARVGNLGWLVRCLQGTLECLEVIPDRAEDNLLSEVCRMKEPRLKRLAFDGREPFEKEDWDRLYLAQPYLEELIVVVDRSSILLGMAQTSLIKALTLYLVNLIAMSFLNDLPRLHFLQVEGFTTDRYDPLLLRGPQLEQIRAPTLREFRLSQMTLINFEFYTLCSQIETIFLDDVKLLNPILAPKSSSDAFPNLRHLDISGCFSVKPVLLHIFTNSPLLEHVRLAHMMEIDDEVMQVLCQRATRLRKLEIDQCLALSDTSGALIIEHCAALEELRLYATRFSSGMVQRLQKARNLRVWCTHFVGPSEDTEF